MLVLTRKSGEKIVIPELEIEIGIVRIVGNRVAVGITAPRKILVLRGELEASERREEVA